MPIRLRAVFSMLLMLVFLSGCASAFKQVAALAIGAERRMADLVRKEIELPGGLRYAFLEGGQGEPLMLLHGFGGNKDNFTRTARYLTPHYRVIVPDHIGFGESARPRDADYTPLAQAERLHALAQALGIRTIHLGGNSMGGQIAMAYAARYPSEVASLWLLDPAGIWNAPKSELAHLILERGQNPLIARSEEEFAQTFAFVMQDPPFVPRPILNVLAQERIRNADLEERIFVKIATDSVEERIKGLAVPTLIVWGEQDRVIHVGTADVLHKLLPRSQVIVMPGVGHLPMIERPRQSAEDYLRFRAAGAAGG
ncbi:MAG TPA: alpha/beta hydrolase [Noviherbaspirillum sp.]|uniref:alpha/beta fold hydrolase n=1 Tax=Noviherbaspirillum sp. TaxID=1926288 RepID=UPI002D6D0126|nr:alpha/beta hydrolase [Noviherbaspirillum sp.]HYD96280.1 alpha/beta hydrolase [Noviherbaspirillum sp.]